MNTVIEEISETRKKLVVTVPAQTIAELEDEVAGEFAKQAKMPGFRPGRAPVQVIRKRYAKDIRKEAENKIAQKAYAAAIEESAFEVLTLVDADGGGWESGQDGTFSFTVDLQPQFELPEYKAIELKVPSEEVTQEEIEATIQEIRRQRSSFEEVNREAAQGDYVKLSYVGTLDGQPVAEIVKEVSHLGKMDNIWEEAGAESSLGISSIAACLVGLKVGDSSEAEHTFPEDFHVEALAGQTVNYSFEIHEVRERKLPELDDKFFRSLQVENLEGLLERVKNELANRKKQEILARKQNQVAENLAGKVEFALPETAVEQETQLVMQEIINANIQRGVPENEFEKHKEEIYANARRTAIQRVKVNFILAKIAENEKVTAENEDFNRLITIQAMKTRTKPDQIVKELQKDRNRVERMRRDIVLSKTLDKVLEEAKIITVEDEEEEAE